MTIHHTPTPTSNVPQWKKALYQAIPNIPRSTTTPLGGKVKMRARTHKNLVALQLLGHERHAHNELAIFDYLKKNFDGSGVFFDVGASIGVFTVPIGLRCKKGGGRVVSFEPDPDNVALLNRNVFDNRIDECVEVVSKAVTDRSGKMNFVRDTVTSESGAFAVGVGSSVGHGDYDKDSVPKEVSTISIDEYVTNNRIIPSVIKVNVHGEQSLVLKGAMKTLERHAPTVIMDGCGLEALHLLWSAGYKVKDIETNQDFTGNETKLPFTVVAYR